jgi:hypothetical protein
MIKIDFEKTNGIYTLIDAICLPDDHKLSDEELEDIKQKRFDDWIQIITTSPIEE